VKALLSSLPLSGLRRFAGSTNSFPFGRAAQDDRRAADCHERPQAIYDCPVTEGYRLNSAKTGGAARFLIYPKGAYILHMLRMLMYDSRDKSGDPDARFKAMMQDFVKTYFNQDASTDDFKRAVENT